MALHVVTCETGVIGGFFRVLCLREQPPRLAAPATPPREGNKAPVLLRQPPLREKEGFLTALAHSLCSCRKRTPQPSALASSSFVHCWFLWHKVMSKPPITQITQIGKSYENELCHALSGLGFSLIPKPRAAPWAAMFGPARASRPCIFMRRDQKVFVRHRHLLNLADVLCSVCSLSHLRVTEHEPFLRLPRYPFSVPRLR